MVNWHFTTMTLTDIKRNFCVLHNLQNSGLRKRKKLLKEVDAEVVKAIVECIYNVLFGDVDLTPEEFSKLKKEKQFMRDLVKKKKSVKKKKELLIQKGGALPLLLGPALALAAGLLGEAIGKNL